MSKKQRVSEAGSADLPESIAIAVDAIEDLKGIDALVLDLREIASFTDYLVICTGSSNRHVQAVVDGIREKLRDSGVTPLHTEGYDQAGWVLVDFVDFLVNVFTQESRDFYRLDRVWRDAPVVVGERPQPTSDTSDSPADDQDPGADADEEGPVAGAGEEDPAADADDA